MERERKNIRARQLLILIIDGSNLPKFFTFPSKLIDVTFWSLQIFQQKKHYAFETIRRFLSSAQIVLFLEHGCLLQQKSEVSVWQSRIFDISNDTVQATSLIWKVTRI